MYDCLCSVYMLFNTGKQQAVRSEKGHVRIDRHVKNNSLSRVVSLVVITLFRTIYPAHHREIELYDE